MISATTSIMLNQRDREKQVESAIECLTMTLTVYELNDRPAFVTCELTLKLKKIFKLVNIIKLN